MLRAGGRPEPKSQIGIRQQVDAPIDLPNGHGRLRHLHWTGGRHLVPLILLPFERAFEAKGGVPGDHRAPRLRRLIHRHFHRRSHHLRRHLVSPKVRPFADPATELTARNQDTWASLPWSLAGRTREGLNNFGHWSSYTMERTHGSIEDPHELEREIERANRLASVVGDQTTYQRLKQFVEELKQNLQGRLAARRSKEAIRARARELWEASGCPPDRDLEFWLKAEEELREAETH